MALPFPVRTSIWVLPSYGYAFPAVTRPSNWTLPSTVTRTYAEFWAMTTICTAPWPAAGSVKAAVSTATSIAGVGPFPVVSGSGVEVGSSVDNCKRLNMGGAVG